MELPESVESLNGELRGDKWKKGAVKELREFHKRAMASAHEAQGVDERFQRNVTELFSGMASMPQGDTLAAKLDDWKKEVSKLRERARRRAAASAANVEGGSGREGENIAEVEPAPSAETSGADERR